MGCTTSKLDDLPAVTLCHHRCNHLSAAIHHRYSLSESHVTYTQSLKQIGQSLHQFINHHHRVGSDNDDSPKNSKTKLTHSDSGSGHLDFDSDSEIDSLHISDHSSPLHQMDFTDYQNSNLHMNYMKNSSLPPSIVYEQRISSSKRVYIGESSNPNYNPYLNPSNSSNPYLNPPNSSNPYLNPPNSSNPYLNPPNSSNQYLNPPNSSNPYLNPPNSSNPYLNPPNSSNPYFDYANYRPGSSSTQPPPPPPPPRSEAWDFLNLFDYTPYTPIEDSRELREEEDIPDLEEDDFHNEVVKEIHGNQKFAVSNPAISTVDDKEEQPGNQTVSRERT